MSMSIDVKATNFYLKEFQLHAIHIRERGSMVELIESNPKLIDNTMCE